MSGTLQVGGITLGTHNSGTGKVDITNAGTVATTTISSGTFDGTIGSSATFPSGTITNAKVLTNATRTSVDSPNSTDRQILAFGNYDKLNSGTKLVIHIVAPAFNFNTSGGVGVGIRYGSGSTVWGGSHYYTAHSYAGFLVAYYYSDSHTTTGSQAVSLRSGQASGTGGRPCGVINPNTTDDSRIPQSRSTAIIYEIM